MSSLLNGWWTLVGSLHKKDDGGGTLLPGEIVGAGRGPIVCGRLGARVSGGTPPGPTWDRPGTLMGDKPTTTKPKYIKGIFT